MFSWLIHDASDDLQWPWKAGCEGSNFSRGSPSLHSYYLTQNNRIRTVTRGSLPTCYTAELDVYFLGSATALHKGRPSAPQFWGFSVYAHSLYCRTTTFGREGLVSWGQPRLLIQGDRAAVLSNFGGFSVYAYSLSATPSIPWGVAPADPNFRSSPTYAYTVWPRVTQFSVVTHIGGASWWCL